MIKHYKKWLVESIQFPTDHNRIKQFLEKLEIKNYSIKPDGTVNINGNVKLGSGNFEYLPIKFGIVKGDFSCSNCHNLKTLKGAPEECETFYCVSCYNLETLEGAPKECENFNCSYCNNLESLEGAPKECEAFYCYMCKNLKSLEGAPEECEIFYCSDCINLKSLEGAPEKCKEFNCSGYNNLKSLEGAPKKCKIFKCNDCEKLETLKGAPEKCEEFDCSSCDNLKTLKGICKECNLLNCSNCKNLEYSLKYFPKCKRCMIENTSFEDLNKKISKKEFIKLINTNSDFEFESILAIGLSRGLNFEKYIKPLLKDKTMTEEAFKHKYRGIIISTKCNF